MKILNAFNKRKGFTLTEILLAVMIVGLIGVALASLTRAGARESGIGRSKIMLRNNLSSFVRLLRKDLDKATRVALWSGSKIGTLPSDTSAGEHLVLLKILEGASQWQSETPVALSNDDSALLVTYCFKVGSDSSGVVPEEALRGGEIYRLTQTNLSSGYKECGTSNYSANAVVLTNVKYIPSDVQIEDRNYPVPFFSITDPTEEELTNSMLKVRLITELKTTPVVNEAVELEFDIPGWHGS